MIAVAREQRFDFGAKSKTHRRVARKPREMTPFSVTEEPGVVLVQLPLHVVSEANMRGHWGSTHKRKKEQQLVVSAHLHRVALSADWSVGRVVFTRYGLRALDSDNLAGAFKHAQDSVAKWLGVDDGDGSVQWVYEQNVGGKLMGISIAFVARGVR